GKGVGGERGVKGGEPCRPSLLDKTRKNLDALHLFRSVRLVEDDSRGDVVNIDVKLAETERHEVKLGVGYDTEEGIRGIAGWRDYKFSARRPPVPPPPPPPPPHHIPPPHRPP